MATTKITARARRKKQTKKKALVNFGSLIPSSRAKASA
jgi:hypothetical protein